MKISVIVTNYNYEKWLRRCVRSLINQNFDDYEIIIIDDCSTDNSRNILLEYQDDDKIKLIFNKSNVGVGCSSTIAAKKALGKYIVRVDADDYVHNDFLKCLYLTFLNFCPDICILPRIKSSVIRYEFSLFVFFRICSFPH